MTAEAAHDRHLSDARCADLVLGLLDADEAGAALAHAAECPACEARLRAHAAADERARVRVPAAVLRPAMPWWRAHGGALAAVAAVTLVAGAAWIAQRGPHDERTLPWLPVGGGIVQRAAGGDPHLAAGLEAYARHDVPVAVRELSAARASGSAEAARRIFLASALLAQGDADAAVGLLESVNFDHDVPEPWRSEGLRTLAEAWRRAGRTPQADSLAHELGVREPGARP